MKYVYKYLQKNKWLFVGFASILLAAPNGTFIRYAVTEINPFLFNVGRFGLLALVTLPFLIIGLRKVTKTNLRYALISAVSMAVAVLGYVWAINLSQASYVAILTLITPISFVVLSAKLTNESISKRAQLGITLAALGAFIIVVFPIAFKQSGEFIFYPLATLLCLINSASFPLAIIFAKKAHQHGLNLPQIMSINGIVITLICMAVVVTQQIPLTQLNSPQAQISIMYSAIAVALVARILNIISYEHIGSAISSGLGYVETLMAVVIPIIILNEELSIEIAVGGALILLGIYVLQHHHSKHHKHFHILRHH